MGVAIEDAILVKALQKGMAPPIANLTDVPEHFADLKFSKGEKNSFKYGIHFSAGFGSQFSLIFLKKIDERSRENNAEYQLWLKRISNNEKPDLKIINNTLVIENAAPARAAGKVSTATAAERPAPIVMEKKSGPSPESVIGAVKNMIMEQTGYSLDMLDSDLDLEADLGIDTVKQVEIFGKISSAYSLEVPEDLKLSELNTIQRIAVFIGQRAAAGGAVYASAEKPARKSDTTGILKKVKEIIAEQTGYSLDMLDSDLDLEADLGIDTVKQVEIFGKISSGYNLEVPEDLKLSELNSISRIVQYISGKTGTLAGESAGTGEGAMPAADAGAVLDKVKGIISEQTGYALDMLDSDLDLEADLGIDTVKQVEIFGKISSGYNLEVPEDLKLSELNTIRKIAGYIAGKTAGSAPSPVHAGKGATVDSGEVLQKVKGIISEQTGYALDMLDSDLDLEADLGIDTVKQVEIFGKISSGYSLEVPEDLKLSELNTIRKIAGYIAGKTAGTAPSSAAAGKGSSADSGEVLQKVKGIISEQTGYALDMLDSDLDLEADLGIDTVKQVEIFGKISSGYSLEVPEDLKLSELNTIRKIAGYIAGKTAGVVAVPAASPVSAPAAVTKKSTDSGSIKRFVPAVEKMALSGRDTNPFQGKKFIVTQDSSGFAGAIIPKIQEMGGTVITMGSAAGSDLQCSLQDLAAVEKIMKEQAGKGINGIIHLSPLDGYFSGREIDEKEIDGSVKSFYVMVKALYKDLNRSGSLLSILSFDSVIFPYFPGVAKIHPVFSGLAGMMKSMNKEMEKVMVKAVDFSYREPLKKISEIADLYLRELMGGDPRVESGYADGERFVLTLKEQAPVKGEGFIKPGDRILVSGGARGITYEILGEVVKGIGDISLVLCGRSDIEKIDPEYLSPGADEKSIFNSLKEKMKGAKPLEVKKATANVMNIRETRANLESLKSRGVRVEYHPVDVSDRGALEALLKKYDRIDGVIHAAGVEISNTIEKKEMSVFNLVFDTKIRGILNLLRSLKGKGTRFLVGFSSVAAKFGNFGQADYSAANDMLGKLLQREKLVNPGMRIKVYDWTAWADTGMATNETVKKVLLESGIELLPVDAGVRFFINDLSDSESDEVVITSHIPAFDLDGIIAVRGEEGVDENFPFLGPLTGETAAWRSFTRVLDPGKDIYLTHHVIDEVPLFLGATGIETMAEAAASLAGSGYHIRELAEFTIPYGIKILKGRPKEIIVKAERDGEVPGRIRTSIVSQFRNSKGEPMGDQILHYSGSYLFSRDEAGPEKVSLPEFKKVACDGDFDELIYHPKRLFMDGLFKTIDGIESFDGKSLVTRFHNRSDQRYFAHIKNPRFVTDAIIIDGMFQTGGLFEFLTTNEIILPYRIKRMNFFRPIVTGDEYLCITEKGATKDKTVPFNLTLADREGNCYLKIEEFEMIKISTLEPKYRVDSRFRFEK